ncbi:hypothetical protein [Aquimarina sediminis]|uniref:hypothetical protein n=1 Tax=Aquimarina sediminis TaxID=2070536 RepID=UPI000CA00A38|nr:hypothetical protein [Aquimarina sediminis]
MITKQEIENAQKVWGQGVVQIGTLLEDREQCESYTEHFVNELYDFDNKEVLFKPTKTAVQQFRITKKGAISYFIGGNSDYQEDKGFALQPWTQVRFENAAVILEENRALAMGNYFFTDVNGLETKVEYTFGYCKASNGNLKIDLHHSSLPFNTGENV